MYNKKTTARTIALDLLRAVELNDAYANLLLPKLLTESKLDSRDIGFAQEMAFGTLRWQLFYDRVIEECAQRYSDEIDIEALIVLRLGAHQILGMRVPSHAAHLRSIEPYWRNADIAGYCGYYSGYRYRG